MSYIEKCVTCRKKADPCTYYGAYCLKCQEKTDEEEKELLLKLKETRVKLLKRARRMYEKL